MELYFPKRDNPKTSACFWALIRYRTSFEGYLKKKKKKTRKKLQMTERKQQKQLRKPQ